MKKLMLSTVVASTLMTGCSNIPTEVVLMPTLIAAGIVTAIIPDKEKKDCAKFPKIKDAEIYDCNPQYNYAIAYHKTNNTYDLIDKDGNILINFDEYDYPDEYGYPKEISPNYFSVRKKDKDSDKFKYGVIDKTGKVIVSLKYSHIFAFKEYFCGDNNKLGVSYHPEGKECYDRDGNLVHGLRSN